MQVLLDRDIMQHGSVGVQSSVQSSTLHFTFSTHADLLLRKMNALREKGAFCDVTLVVGGVAGRPLRFRAHRVVLAASSDFLRDQFLLHEGQAELSVAVVSRVEVGRRLLVSCYTGQLEVRPEPQEPEDPEAPQSYCSSSLLSAGPSVGAAELPDSSQRSPPEAGGAEVCPNRLPVPLSTHSFLETGETGGRHPAGLRVGRKRQHSGRNEQRGHGGWRSGWG